MVEYARDIKWTPFVSYRWPKTTLIQSRHGQPWNEHCPLNGSNLSLLDFHKFTFISHLQSGQEGSRYHNYLSNKAEAVVCVLGYNHLPFSLHHLSICH